MNTINVNLTDSLVKFAELQASRSGLRSASEYLSKLVSEARERAMADDLEHELLDGIDSGESIPVDDTWWQSQKDSISSRLDTYSM